MEDATLMALFNKAFVYGETYAESKTLKQMYQKARCEIKDRNDLEDDIMQEIEHLKINFRNMTCSEICAEVESIDKLCESFREKYGNRSVSIIWIEYVRPEFRKKF